MGYLASTAEYYIIQPGMLYVELHVAKPDQNGDGGGTVLSVTALSPVLGDSNTDLRPEVYEALFRFEQEFEQIRQTIRRALDLFRDLPVSELIDCDRFPMVEATSMLVPPFRQADDPTSSNVGLSTLANHWMTLCSQVGFQHSRTMTAFTECFVNPLYDRIGWCFWFAGILTSGLAGESNLWEKVPADLHDVIAKTSDAFETYDPRGGPPIDWKLLIDLASVMFDALALVLPELAPAFIVVSGVLQVGSDLIKTSNDQTSPTPEERPVSSSTFTSILSGFVTAVDDLATDVFDQETKLHDELILTDNECASEIRLSMLKSLPGSAATTPDDLETAVQTSHMDVFGDVPADMILFEDGALASLANLLRDIAQDMSDVKAQLYKATETVGWVRDDRLGIGRTGPRPQWDKLRWNLIELLGKRMGECETAADMIDAIGADFDEASEESSQAFQELEQEIMAGDPHP